MKFLYLFLILILSSFVLAGSEAFANFEVNGDNVDKDERYIAPEGFWNNYGEYVFGILFIVILIIAGFRKFGRVDEVKKVGKAGKKTKRKKKRSKKK